MGNTLKLRIESAFSDTGFVSAERAAQRTRERVERMNTGVVTGAKKAGAAVAAQGKEISITAGQQAAAMRMLPAQMTDITVGLATGQKPLMVLLQQGGQLKDMFGGILPAVKAVGGALLKMINPVTLAVAALGATIYWISKQYSDQIAKHKLLVESTLGMQKRLAMSLELRVGKVAKAYDDMAKAMARVAAQKNALESASAKNDESVVVGQVALLTAQSEQAQAKARTPEIAKEIELDYARKIAEVELAGAVVAAQYRENEAKRELNDAEKLKRMKVRELNELRDLADIEADMPIKKRQPTLNKIAKAEEELKEMDRPILTAQMNLEAAINDVKTARLKEAVGVSAAMSAIENNIKQSKEDYERRKRMGEVEGKLYALTEKQSKLMDAKNRRDAVQNVAARKADAAGRVPLKDWIENQRKENEEKRVAVEEEEKFKDQIKRLEEKKARGIKLSRHDEETLQLREQRRRILEAPGPKKTPELEQLEAVSLKLDELKNVRDDLKKAMKTG